MSHMIRSALITFEKDLTEQEFAIFQIVMTNIRPVQAIEAIEPLYADLSIATAEQKVREDVSRQLVDLARRIIERK